jgi:hypothetical protein
LNWLETGVFSAGVNPAVPIINWLCYVQAERKLAWSTVKTMKSAVLALFEDPDIVTKDRLFVSFLRAIDSSLVVDTKRVIFDIKPVLQHFRDRSNDNLDMEGLTSKLCWLLGLCGFMRPDAIACVDMDKSSVANGRLSLAVVYPKELRGSQRIIKYITISPHFITNLCPVKTYEAYVERIQDHPIRIAHHKDSKRIIMPLLHYIKDPTKALTSARIGVLQKQVSALMFPEGTEVPKTLPSLRAMGSTLAAMAGVPVADIMVQGNWSSPKIFEQHYRLSSTTSTNMSTYTLRSL